MKALRTPPATPDRPGNRPDQAAAASESAPGAHPTPKPAAPRQRRRSKYADEGGPYGNDVAFAVAELVRAKMQAGTKLDAAVAEVAQTLLRAAIADQRLWMDRTHPFFDDPAIPSDLKDCALIVLPAGPPLFRNFSASRIEKCYRHWYGRNGIAKSFA